VAVRRALLGAAAVSRPLAEATAPQVAPAGRAEAAPERSLPVAEALVLAVGVTVLTWAGRDMWFIADDWRFLLDRRDLSVDALLAPHNEHWLALPLLVFRAVLGVAGLGSYTPFLAVAVAFHAAATVAGWAALRRLGVPRAPAALAGLALLLMGSAYEQLFTAFQLSWTAPTLLFLIALQLLDRSPARDADLAAALCLCLAMPFGGVAIAFTLGTGGGLVLRRQFRRATLVAGPALALYGGWRAVWGVSPPIEPDVLLRVPGYVAYGLAAAVAGYTGLPLLAAAALVVALGLGLLAAAWAGHAAPAANPRVSAPTRPDAWVARGLPLTAWAALGALAVFYGTAGLARLPLGGASQAGASRYLWLGALLLLVSAAAALAGRWTRGVTLAVSVALGLCLATNIADLRRESAVVRAARGQVAVRVLAADALLADGLSYAPTAQPEPGTSPDISAQKLVDLRADGYRLAYGGPAEVTGEMVEEVRLRLQAAFLPVPELDATADLAVLRVDGEASPPSGGCVTLTTGPGGGVVLDASTGLVALRGAPGTVVFVGRDGGSFFATDLGGSGAGALELAEAMGAGAGAGALDLRFPSGAEVGVCGATLRAAETPR